MNDIREICHQEHLHKALKVLFPNTDIRRNARKDVTVKSAAGYFVELDLWLPDLHLGFEFQDAYHYVSMWYVNVPLSYIQKKDDRKHENVRRLGSTVITVPCWWDATLDSLISTILFHRPDLSSSLMNFVAPRDRDRDGDRDHHPVSFNPTPLFFSNTRIPGVGDLMLASFISTVSAICHTLFDNAFWWMGEKYDGVHCVWHPPEQKLFSRRGKQVDISDVNGSHLRALRPIGEFIEGEIWNGRGEFLESQKILEKTSFSEIPYTRIVAFDSPSPMLHHHPYESRYLHVIRSVPIHHPFVGLSLRTSCASHTTLHTTLHTLIAQGAEGLMVQRVASRYERGRSMQIIKFKASLGDCEALVVSVDGDSLNLQLPSGIIFEIQQSFDNSNSFRKPKKGDIVTIEYDNFVRKDIPVNPKIIRIREDLSWEDVVYDFFSNSPQPYDVKSLGFITKPTGYWLKDNGKNLRLFLEDFAKKRNLDPLVPETWYTIRPGEFEHTEVKTAIYQGGSFVNTLAKIFPEVNFDVIKFSNLPKGYFVVVANRRIFFDTLAQAHNFDPLVPENWYSFPPKILFEKTEAYSFIATYYQGNYQEALQHVYPNVGFDLSKFYYRPNRFMDTLEFRKRFFERYAKARGFDPLVPENWYDVDDRDIKAQKNSARVLQQNAQSVARTLVDVFPTIGLVLDKFQSLPRGYWGRFKNRKRLFDEYARANAFDPLVASNWRNQPFKFLSIKGAMNVMHYYKGNFRAALNNIYPSLNLSQLLSRGHWAKKEIQKKFFDDFAREKGFDPLIPDNWYSVSYYAIAEKKHAGSIIAHHDGSMKIALMNIYPNIGLKKHKFQTVRYYSIKSNRKLFFDSLAKENEFDPEVASNWKRVDEELIRNKSGSKHVLKYYDGDMQKALQDLYPTPSFMLAK